MGVIPPQSEPGPDRGEIAPDQYSGADEAFYRFDGDFLVPGPLCGGPWDPDHQHGGAVSGVLAHLVESVPTAVPMRFCRHTVELMRGVPMRPLTSEIEVLRDGRRLQVVRASLLDGGSEVARATSVRMRIAPVPNPVNEDMTAHFVLKVTK